MERDKLTETQLKYIEALQHCNGNAAQASRWLQSRGIEVKPRTVRNYRKYYEKTGFARFVEKPPNENRSAEEIIEVLENSHNKKEEIAELSRLMTVDIEDDGPIGICHMGDPHIDDCHIRALMEDCRIVRETPGMIAGNVGDYTNNWIGRLTEQHAKQKITAQEAWTMVKWYLDQCDFLYLIGGNHDMWHTGCGFEPVKFMAQQNGQMYKPHGARLKLVFPNGAECVINARHDFKGGSQWNPTHAMQKAAKLGYMDDIYVCGHKHYYAYQREAMVSMKLTHFIRVCAYKQYEDYPDQLGIMETPWNPSVTTIINPYEADNPFKFIKAYDDTEEAAAELTRLRKEYGCKD